LLACQPIFAQSVARITEGPVFDTKGHQIAYAYPDGTIDTYAYDDLGRMKNYTDRKGAITTFTYTQNGSMTVFHSDGSTEVRK
jgi:YD repeat-containing protein